MTWIILRNKTQSSHCCSSSSYGLHLRLQRPITVSTPTKAWLNPDETIGIDPTKDCVCLIQSVIAETFRSVHDTLNVSVSKSATNRLHVNVILLFQRCVAHSDQTGRKKAKSVLI